MVQLAGGKAIAGLLSVAYLVVATHRLGVSGYGVLVTVNAYVVLIGGIVAFSGLHGVVRYGTVSLERGDHAGFAHVVRFLAVIELACGGLAILVAALLVPWIGPRLGWSPTVAALALPYSFAVIATVRATPQGLLQIAGRFDLLGLHQIVSPAARLVGAIVVWTIGYGLGAFIAVWLVAAILEGLSMWALGLIAWNKLAKGEPLLGQWRGAHRNAAGLARFTIISNLDLTTRELAPNLAPITVGWVLGPAAAGLFALAQRATALLAQPAQLLAQASYSVLARQAARGEFGGLSRTVWRSVAIALAVSLAFVVLLAQGGPGLLALLGGKSFVVGAQLLVLVAAARGFALVSAPVAAALTAIGKPQRPLAVGLMTSIGLFPLLPLLLWRFGIEGAGWHAAIQGTIAAAALIGYFQLDIGRLRNPTLTHDRVA